ncbi:MAG: L-threonylcarbamoyladenylate synthase [Tissierellia bacterium]|nr:L-threonylcarbamoyladenylate synthase [Tissierellia bacterium]
MQTKIVDILSVKDELNKIQRAADIIRSGGLVAMPTETVYGLAADGLNEEAVKKIFDVKKRPADNPLILHISSEAELHPLVSEISDWAKILIDKLWPGPLTIIFKKSDIVPSIISAGGDTVAIRMPDNEIAKSLIRLSQTPIAAPSANLSGKPSPTNAIDVYVDLNGKIDMILDGGGSEIGIESTVVDTSDDIPRILRPGFYDYELLKEIIPDIIYDDALIEDDQRPRSPGQKYKHYAPIADLYVYSTKLDDKIGRMQSDVEKYKSENKNVGILTFNENMPYFNADVMLNVGSKYDIREMARVLFSKLRDFDRMGVDIILAEGVEEKGLGFAIMNRLKKSAGNKVIE